MRKIKIGIYRLVLALNLLFLAGFICGIVVYAWAEEAPRLITSGIANSCSGDLEEKVNCLQEQLEGFYKYNYSNVGKPLNLDELKEQGGVCSHYSEWYVDNLNSLNVSAFTLLFEIDDKNSHEIALAHDDKGYCMIDQLSINCVEYAKDDKSE